MIIHQVQTLRRRMLHPLAVGWAVDSALESIPLCGLAGSLGEDPEGGGGGGGGGDDAGVGTSGGTVMDPGMADAIEQTRDTVKSKACYRKVVFDVQVACLTRGAYLDSGLDGCWGPDSAKAFATATGGQAVTRENVSALVGYSYTGPMSVFGVSETGTGTGTTISTPPTTEQPPDAPPGGSLTSSPYFVPGLIAAGCGFVGYLAWRAYGKRGRR